MMASTKPLTAIVERLKAKAKLPNEADHDWIKFPRAVTEVIEAFGICSEAASMMLFGLIATGQVRALDNHQGFIDLDDCTIADLEGKPRFISANQLRSWLRQWSAVPTADRDRVIAEKLRAGEIPGRSIPWKEFCDDVRNKCNGWRGKGKPDWGFGDKQIRRIVSDLMDK
jgi:hypothetical protein